MSRRERGRESGSPAVAPPSSRGICWPSSVPDQGFAVGQGKRPPHARNSHGQCRGDAHVGAGLVYPAVHQSPPVPVRSELSSVALSRLRTLQRFSPFRRHAAPILARYPTTPVISTAINHPDKHERPGPSLSLHRGTATSQKIEYGNKCTDGRANGTPRALIISHFPCPRTRGGTADMTNMQWASMRQKESGLRTKIRGKRVCERDGEWRSFRRSSQGPPFFDVLRRS